MHFLARPRTKRCPGTQWDSFSVGKTTEHHPRVSKHQTGITAVAAFVIIQVPWMARHCPTHCSMRFLTYCYAKQSMEVWRTLKRTQMVCLGCWTRCQRVRGHLRNRVGRHAELWQIQRNNEYTMKLLERVVEGERAAEISICEQHHVK